MARYIDVDILTERIKYYHSHTGDQRSNAEHYAYGVVLKEIEQIPVANVAEIKQGEWIICCDGYYPYCSLCGYEPIRPLGNYDNRTPYCPNCGAKMRKEWEGI